MPYDDINTGRMGMLAQGVQTHEGLEPGQTPFRITSDNMAKWQSMFDDTIRLGLDPEASKSPGREAFLYAKNPDDVFPAIIEQFRRYTYNPEKYGLPEDPTVEQAIRVFDQTGADDKIAFLQEELGIDPSVSLRVLFEEDEADVQTPLPSTMLGAGER